MQTEIHETAIVMPGAEIGAGCSIGAFSIIGSMARIEDHVTIGSHCELGVETGTLPSAPLIIGSSSFIRSGSVFYQGSRFGAHLKTGHRVTVREGITAGKGLQIGTMSDLQGHCSIGDYVRLHSNVHIGQKTKIGNFVWIFPYVVLTNDPHPPSEYLQGCSVGDFAVIATMSTVLPGREIGKDVLIGAMTLVKNNVPSSTIYSGVPGQVVGNIDKVKFKNTGESVYPWRRHFHRGYPTQIVEEWKKEFEN